MTELKSYNFTQQGRRGAVPTVLRLNAEDAKRLGLTDKDLAGTKEPGTESGSKGSSSSSPSSSSRSSGSRSRKPAAKTGAKPANKAAAKPADKAPATAPAASDPSGSEDF